MAAGNVKSAEYKTIAALTNDLNLAVRSNLISVGGSLVSCVLITPDDYDNLRNRMHPESDRAANLVTLVLRKIQEDPGNYRKFVGVLEQDKMQYEHILSKLKHQYEFQQSNQQLEDFHQGAVGFSNISTLNREIEPRHLGRIAHSMSEWEGIIADELELTSADVSNIKGRHQNELRLQAKEALETWKQKKGNAGTYAELMQVFEGAGYRGYADSVRRICAESGNGVTRQETSLPASLNTAMRIESDDGGTLQTAVVPSSGARVPEVRSGGVAFSVSMSDKEFVHFLRGEGLTEKDCTVVVDNGIGAKIFVTDITEKDIDDQVLPFTFGGRKVLKRILKKVSTSTDGDQN